MITHYNLIASAAGANQATTLLPSDVYALEPFNLVAADIACVLSTLIVLWILSLYFIL